MAWRYNESWKIVNSYSMSEMFIVANHKRDPSIGHGTGLKRKSLFHIYKKLNNCCYSKQVGAQGPRHLPSNTGSCLLPVLLFLSMCSILVCLCLFLQCNTMLLPSDVDDSSEALGLEDDKLLYHFVCFNAVEKRSVKALASWEALPLSLCWYFCTPDLVAPVRLLKLAYVNAILFLMSNVAPCPSSLASPGSCTCPLPPPCCLSLSVYRCSWCWPSSTFISVVSASMVVCLRTWEVFHPHCEEGLGYF